MKTLVVSMSLAFVVSGCAQATRLQRLGTQAQQVACAINEVARASSGVDTRSKRLVRRIQTVSSDACAALGGAVVR